MTATAEAAPSPPVDRGGTTAIRFRFAVGLTILVAFVVRLLHVLSYDPWPTSDMAVFVDMATRRLTLANIFSPSGACRYPPGYALFLKPFLLVLDPFAAFTAVRIAQALLGAATCWLVYRAGCRLHSRRAGLVGALLTCFFQHFIFYSSAYMSENLFIPCFLAAFLAFLLALQRGGARHLYVAGLLAGAAALVRPAAAALAPAALMAALVFARKGKPGSAGRSLPGRLAGGLALVLAGGMTLIGPWALRNWIALGSPVLISPTGSFNLAIGNGRDATGWYREVPTPGLEGEARDRELRAQVESFVEEDPWAALYVVARLKWNAFWAGVPPWPLGMGNPSLFAGGFFFPSLSWRLVLFGGLLGLGLLSVERPRAALASAACAGAYVAYYMIFFGQPRFRMPIESLFLCWSGIAVAGLAARLLPRRAMRGRVWAAGAAVLLAAVVMESSAAAVLVRKERADPASLIASSPPLRLAAASDPVALFGPEPIPLDRARGRYVRVRFMARRSGPSRATPANGSVRITFLDQDGETRSWLATPELRLDALPPDRWVPVEMKAHIPPSTASCRVEILPDRQSPDTVRLAQIGLSYEGGNDLALEFLFPYLRYNE